ncbi:single-stranded DNA-binding protein [Bacillus cereus]|uniref:single-stranded DNA-binding protein n=1 Tax=Bacillus toyonensis TaxID=155322 RepID=UPI000BFCA0F2|nr:single-stranded DNA-binding protein [Bacillus toyonensis]MEB9856292.1 single-stranded DNA-binding protein [Bacillus cereus]MEB9891933.1 single-stranded DNA-binding protein [Bacillus cereus]PHA80321.1 single-stranded DNA-binding protein [Bacillus toyonensis]
MLNRTILVGRLTKDPDLRYTPNGVAVATFTLAVNRAFSNQQGEREADFINCVIWRKQAENVANYLRKGSLAGVDGRLQTRNYQGQDGKRVYVTEVLAESVQFLEPRNSRGEQSNSFNQQPVGAGFGNGDSNQFKQSGNQGNSGFKKNDDPFSNVGQPIDISDDDLPF